MLSSAPFSIHALTPDDLPVMEAMLTTFGEAFDDAETYGRARPNAAYLKRLLGGDSFIALAALKSGEVVGGIAAYELRKFEQERSEIYIYDLAVAAAHRREGIATALILELKKIAATRGAYVFLCKRISAMRLPSRSTRNWERARMFCTLISRSSDSRCLRERGPDESMGKFLGAT